MQWIFRLGAAALLALFAVSSLPVADDVSSCKQAGKAVVHAKSHSSGSVLGLRRVAAEAGALPPFLDPPVLLERCDPGDPEIFRALPVVPCGNNRAPPV